ncbi:MAG: cytidylate kinase-like family protein [Spirochaetaceae bacterium]|jgi:cytidylate kinase|nr:cytidylate kinase-like family protein [Spirochaetaceae bacterium]
MAIITISRELAALGDETARELARLSGCRLADRKFIEEKIKQYGANRGLLKKFDERKPGFFSSLSAERDDYLHYLKTAIIDAALEGNCIFIGRGAFAVLGDLPAALPVMLVSTREARIERVRGYFRCDEKKALEIITRSDNDRSGFYSYFFDVKWRDSANYKITLNTARLTPSVCAELIDRACALIAAPDAEAATQKKLAELRLAQKIIHNIVYEKSISVQFLDAVVSGSTATLYGVAGTLPLAEAALEAARNAVLDAASPDGGVKNVVSEIQILQETTPFH